MNFYTANSGSLFSMRLPPRTLDALVPWLSHRMRLLRPELNAVEKENNFRRRLNNGDARRLLHARRDSPRNCMKIAT